MAKAGLPISIEALGQISYLGLSNDPGSRLSRRDSFIILDGSHTFLRCPMGDTAEMFWARAPHFFCHPKSEPSSFIHFPVQLNEQADPERGVPSLHALYDRTKREAYAFVSPKQIHRLTAEETTLLEKAEISLLEKELDQAEKVLEELFHRSIVHPRLFFAIGALNYLQGEYPEARYAFHEAVELGHPDAFDAELAALNQETQPLRESHPEVFLPLQTGEPLRALTGLRMLREAHPLHVNSVLAYCLRHAHEPEEGVEACRTSLALEPNQSDVLGHLWSYLTKMKMDEEAYNVALEHLARYPSQPQAYVDALHSSLLLGLTDEAYWYAYGYLLYASNGNLALKHLFTLYEHSGHWDEAHRVFEQVTPSLRAPTPETLLYQGEIQSERDNYEQACQYLEKAMQAQPENAQVVLSYARALARSGDSRAAVKLLSSAMKDSYRDDHPADQILMIALLSELYRNSGDLESALSLWPPQETFSPKFLSQVGPRPLVEYAYCMAEAGQEELSQQILELLEPEFHSLKIVEQLKHALTGES